MSDFRVSQLQRNSILYLYAERASVQMEPYYQRSGDIWPREKRQLLIDSILNGYDIPKLYFHEFVPAKRIDDKMYKYAIIDGKQRLQSIWAFIDNRFPLSADFQYFEDETVNAKGLTYGDLGQRFPKLKLLIDSYCLSVVTIQTEDIELIEDMFYRLNESAPLNAAEKRNAYGGELPGLIRTLSGHEFFLKRIPFSNRRFRHYDLATKFLYFEAKSGVAQTKKYQLDEFVASGRIKKELDTPAARESLRHALAGHLRTAEAVLSAMSNVFIEGDWLLRSVGGVTVYYHVFRAAPDDPGLRSALTRANLELFETQRRANREKAEEDISAANFDLLEYDRLANSINDAESTTFRVKVLRNFLLSQATGAPLAAGPIDILIPD